ncbi:MAG: glutathione S-transferase family protein [Rhodobacteraceae bacterium]|nr:glutathione S-transferase family protein [Paracoccaceae bacterium]
MSSAFILYHYPISPFSRKVRLVLAEKKFEFSLREERYWERRQDYIKINPTGKVPALIDSHKNVFADSNAICEYLISIASDDTVPLIPEDPVEQCEMRRVIAYFDETFYQEVTKILLFERMLRRIQKKKYTDEKMIRTGSQNLRRHIKYLGHLVENRNWVAGNRMSLADFAVAAQLSCLDYVDDIEWESESLEGIKNWYSALKSRPAFLPLLSDHVPGYIPPRHYAQIDF